VRHGRRACTWESPLHGTALRGSARHGRSPSVSRPGRGCSPPHGVPSKVPSRPPRAVPAPCRSRPVPFPPRAVPAKCAIPAQAALKMSSHRLRRRQCGTVLIRFRLWDDERASPGPFLPAGNLPLPGQLRERCAPRRTARSLCGLLLLLSLARARALAGHPALPSVHPLTACSGGQSAIAGATTADLEALPGVTKWECTSQTLAHRIILPPATTSRMIPQSHQSFRSPSLLIACITARQMCGSGAWRQRRRVDFPPGSNDIAVALTLPPRC
jgi:hypothetical protein